MAGAELGGEETVSGVRSLSPICSVSCMKIVVCHKLGKLKPNILYVTLYKRIMVIK